jgi:hypothetical protein
MQEQPVLVGKMGYSHKELRNTYYITKAGLLIPAPTYFFGDSFRIVNNLGLFVRGLQEGHITREEYDQEVLDGRKCLDEILAIADPKRAQGLVHTDLNGKYLPETKNFLNSEVIFALYFWLSKPQYDFKNKKFRVANARLKELWESAQQRYFDYHTRLWNETEDEVPRGLKDLGAKFHK